MPRRVWTPEMDAVVVQGLAEGLSYKQIADRVGRTLGQVAAYISEHHRGKSLRKPGSRQNYTRVNDDVRDQMIAMRVAGATIRRIAAHFGVSIDTVRNRVPKATAEAQTVKPANAPGRPCGAAALEAGHPITMEALAEAQFRLSGRRPNLFGLVQR